MNIFERLILFLLIPGAFGYFEVTHDITKYTKAKVFEKVGKKTNIAIRFSTVGGESGSADTVCNWGNVLYSIHTAIFNFFLNLGSRPQGICCEILY